LKRAEPKGSKKGIKTREKIVKMTWRRCECGEKARALLCREDVRRPSGCGKCRTTGGGRQQCNGEKQLANEGHVELFKDVGDWVRRALKGVHGSFSCRWELQGSTVAFGDW
jgi:hypothetical protein